VSDFYIGYLPTAPAGLRRTVLWIIVAINAIAVALALALVFGEGSFADSLFEYQQYRAYEGTISEQPYPSLLTTDGERYWLVAPGKHGAEGFVQGSDGQGARLMGSLIRYGHHTMLEMASGSIESKQKTVDVPERRSLGLVTLTGEIVDSKCYFGVMNPGNGKVHRSCAARCISGGIPPAFLVKDASGVVSALILAGADRGELKRRILDFVAEPVEISGELFRSGAALILDVEPGSVRAAGRE
jgi:hypothetical protein